MKMKKYRFLFYCIQESERIKIPFEYDFEKERLTNLTIREIKKILGDYLKEAFQISLKTDINSDFNLYYNGELLKPSFTLADYKIKHKKENIVIIYKELPDTTDSEKDNRQTGIYDIDTIENQYFREMMDPNIKLREINSSLKQQITEKRKRRYTKQLITDLFFSLLALILIIIILKLTKFI